jgi:hypothetical protein
MFFVELKPASNTDTFNLDYIHQCKKKFLTIQTQKGYCSMCKLPKIRAHQKVIAFSNRDVSNMQVTT